MRLLTTAIALLLANTAHAASSILNISPTVSTGTYYVAKSGSDSNPGSLGMPFLTLARAKTAMEASPTNPQTVDVRTGTYSETLVFTSVDNWQTWSVYIPDGYGNAIVDGGASSPTTGANPITVRGVKGLTWNGFTVQNFQQWGVGIHGGAADSNGGFPSDDPFCDSVTISNNYFANGYTTTNLGWSGGAIWQDGQATRSTFTHNAITNQYGSGIRVVPFSGTASPYTYSGLTITGNVLLNVNQYPGDNGAIYREDIYEKSTGVSVTNNFIRDYQNTSSIYNGHVPKADVAIYLDQGSSNTIVSGNVIGPTQLNSIVGSSSVNSPMAFLTTDGHNNSFIGNIVDLGAAANIQNMNYGSDGFGVPMTGNVIEQNIFIGKWSGTQQSWSLGVGPYAWPSSNGNVPVFPTLTHNMYFNYGTGSLSTTGNNYSDASPTTASNPSFASSQCTYTLSGGSPALNAPISFPGITGGWGPPGYTIPCTGTAPSYQ